MSHISPVRSGRPYMRFTAQEALALVSPTPTLPIDNLAAAAPRGDGHAVLVLPSLIRGDAYTASVRELLKRIGYCACGWDLGVNTGPTPRLLAGALHRLTELSDRYGPVSLVGFSMGGLFARWLAVQAPARVRQVITVCSPIHDPLNTFWLPLEPFVGLWQGADLRDLAAVVRKRLPVPCTVIYSRDDGLVNGAACIDDGCPDDCIELPVPHVLIARDPQVMQVLTQRLAQPRPLTSRAPEG